MPNTTTPTARLADDADKPLPGGDVRMYYRGGLYLRTTDGLGPFLKDTPIVLALQRICKDCNGTGIMPHLYLRDIECHNCNGAGWLDVDDMRVVIKERFNND